MTLFVYGILSKTKNYKTFLIVISNNRMKLP